MHTPPQYVFNFYEQLRNDLSFNRFEVDDLLFVEYNCPLESEVVRIWSHTDYIVYVLSGVKTWETRDGVFTIGKGESLYVQKGAHILNQHLEEDFCMLAFFIGDEIIRDVIAALKGKVAIPVGGASEEATVSRLHDIPNLDAFYQSMLSYFRYSRSPVSSILELKAKELLMHIIGSGTQPELTAYLHQVASRSELSIRRVMEANFQYNLSQTEFAELCHRSLSSFKRAFKAEFGTSPGKWLLDRRLLHAADLLVRDSGAIAEVCYASGFEDPSHFSKVFKDRYGLAPQHYRAKQRH